MGEIINQVTRVSRTTDGVAYEKMRFLSLAQAKRAVAVGYVYFIHSRATQSLKIGFTACAPRTRLRELQTATAERLMLLGWISGSRNDEYDLHKRFAEYRVRGEWFRYTGDLRDFVSNLIGGDRKALLRRKRAA